MCIGQPRVVPAIRRVLLLATVGAPFLGSLAVAQTTNSGVGLYPSEKLSHPLNESPLNAPQRNEHLLGGAGDGTSRGQRSAASPGSRTPVRPNVRPIHP